MNCATHNACKTYADFGEHAAATRRAESAGVNMAKARMTETGTMIVNGGGGTAAAAWEWVSRDDHYDDLPTRKVIQIRDVCGNE